MMNLPSLDIGNFLSKGIFGGVGLIVLIAFGLYFFRNQLKSIIGNMFGYRKNIDDYTISIHANREVIYKNETIKLKEGLSFKVALNLFLISLTMLVSPFLFLVLLVANRYKYINTVTNKLQDFTIFKEFDKSNSKLDSLLTLLNNKSDKINFMQ